MLFYLGEFLFKAREFLCSKQENKRKNKKLALAGFEPASLPGATWEAGNTPTDIPYLRPLGQSAL